MYDGPITVTEMIDDIARKVTRDKENYIYEQICHVGVEVDKEELIKALKYDRQQYEKGFNEAADALTAEFIEVLSNIQKELNDIEMMKSIVPNIATVQQIENVIYRIDMYLNMLKEKKSGDL